MEWGYSTVNQSQYPPLDPSGSLPTPRHPYFGLGNTWHEDDNVIDDAGDTIRYDVDDNNAFDRAEEESAGSDSEDEEEDDFLGGISHSILAMLDQNTEKVDADFTPPGNLSDAPSEDDSGSTSSQSAPLEDLGEGRRGAARGRSRGPGRGRGRGRGRGFGLGPGSQGGVVRNRGGPRGRPRGSKSAMRGEIGRGGRKGKRGPRATAEPSREFKALQAQATTAFLEKRYDDALEHAQQAVTINPEIFAAHSLISQIYAEMGNQEASLETLWYGAHTRRDSGVWWEIANRIAEFGDGNREKTLKGLEYCYQRILELDADDFDARKGRMDIFVEQGRTSRAVRQCWRLVKSRPNDLDTLQMFAELCLKDNDGLQAKKAYDRVLEHYKQVQADGIGGDFSFSDLNIYLEIFAHLKEWTSGLITLKSVARWLLGRKDETFWDQWQEDDCEWDIEDEPRRSRVPGFTPSTYGSDAYGDGLPPEIRAKLGLFRLNLGQDHNREAMHHFEFFDPGDNGPEATVLDYPDLFRDIADALRSHSHPTDALRFYEPLKKTNLILDLSLRKNMALCYQQSSRWKLAIECYESIIEDQPYNVDCRVELAKVYEANGDSVKALEQVTSVMRLTKKDASQVAKMRAERDLNSIADESDVMGASELPRRKPTASTRPRRTIKASEKTLEQKRIHVEGVKLLYERMQTILPLVRSGDTELETEWMEGTAQLIEEFKASKVFFPSDRHIRFLGYSVEARKRALKPKPGEPTTELEFMADRLQTSLGNDEEDILDEAQYVPKQYLGISFTAWLDLFCENAFCSAQKGDVEAAYETLTTATEANVFFHNEEHISHIYVCWFACALKLEDEERLCLTGRWFVKQYPFATDTFRLFSALNRLYHGEPSWYNSGPTQKFILRQIKQMDFSLLDEESRKRFKFSAMERASYLSSAVTSAAAVPGNPHGLTTTDPSLLLLYGHLLATASSYPNALNYYFRAHAADPGNPLVVFSISLAYLQYAMKRQSDNRHYLALQGVAFFREYRRLRLEDAKGLGKREMWLRRTEVEFNEGRLWHLLGLVHLAVPAYERCLAVGLDDVGAQHGAEAPAIDGDVQMTEMDGEPSRQGARDGEARALPAEPDFKREAAFALQTALALGGDLEGAREVTMKWLVF